MKRFGSWVVTTRRIERVGFEISYSIWDGLVILIGHRLFVFEKWYPEYEWEN